MPFSRLPLRLSRTRTYRLVVIPGAGTPGNNPYQSFFIVFQRPSTLILIRTRLPGHLRLRQRSPKRPCSTLGR
ncbi:hypothetical protein XA68_14929 [Ophiocordyceps unilateralis]|uniref:Uncharacterized protein n=1 Tax=Ophiocordyceps unilateralis TaxID=268505 RepID=A0A2A9PU49_OPHUN|nr:hypothetical protein XA68_14929 [Ophiocordyceps unilateralis]